MEKEEKKDSLIVQANTELNDQLTKDPSVMRTLTATIFKGFKDERTVKQACLEAMIRGYSFKDIVSKKVYAIPFSGGYALVQSINDVRSIAMRNGQVGKSAPEFEEKDGKIISCTVTVKRKVDDYVGDYTATVYFDEYNKGKDNWKTKPRTMIAKVAEMHALRMAFPEELNQSYIEEEFQKDKQSVKNDEINQRIEEKKNKIKVEKSEEVEIEDSEVFDEEEYNQLIQEDEKN